MCPLHLTLSTVFDFVLLLTKWRSIHFDTGMFVREIKKFNLMQIFVTRFQDRPTLSSTDIYNLIPVWQAGQKIMRDILVKLYVLQNRVNPIKEIQS